MADQPKKGKDIEWYTTTTTTNTCYYYTHTDEDYYYYYETVDKFELDYDEDGYKGLLYKTHCKASNLLYMTDYELPDY